jgi:anaerobic ribonucleoside-triphosphate reductase
MKPVKIRKKNDAGSVTDISLLIEHSDRYCDWSDQELVNSITQETNISEDVAKEIAAKTREKISDLMETMGWTSISTGLIREIVEQELMNKGKKYKDRAKKYRTLGLSESEITKVIENEGSADNGNLSHSPDAVLFVAAETMVKQYALKHVFPSEVVEAHLQGDISLHDLGQVFKVYCGSHSVEYIKKHGLNLSSVLSKSKPAKSASVLVNHMLTFSATIQNQFAGAVGFDAVNVFFAPFLINKTHKQMKQVAQELFFGFSQSAFSRGGQSLFSDLNFYLTVPPQYIDAKAIGPGGKYVKLVNRSVGSVPEYELENCEKSEASTYREFEPWVQKFAYAVLEVMEEGDSAGLPFAFPKGDFHIDKNVFKPEHKWLMDRLAKTIAVNGSPYMIFDRGDGWKISQCCRLQKEFGEGDKALAKEQPESIRFQAIQNITLNLPRIGYRFQQNRIEAGNNLDPFEFVKKEIDRLLEICLTAHKAKKKYIKRLLSLENTPLHILKYGMDGKGYMDLEKVVYLVGLLGLNEMVQAVTGKELHEGNVPFDFGMKTIAYLSLRVKEIGEKEGMAIVLEESPAESTSKRLAKLDDYHFNGAAAKYIRGNKETGAIYYTNSIHMREDCGVDFVERIKKQSMFHAMVSGGSIIHLWVGENLPSAASVLSLMKKTFDNTRCTQLTVSPEFTLCEKCCTTMVGLKGKCQKCGNADQAALTQITRVVGYYSRVANWVDSKKEELHHRQHDFSLEGGRA